MSSIRLFILGSLRERGPMHGHALRLLAEQEHIDEWTDFGAGAIYGAIKRLATDGHIEELRVEREGNYPARSVYGLTDAGARALVELRRDGLETLVLRPDPVDLALVRLDPENLDAVRPTLESRLAELTSRRDAWSARLPEIRHYLSVMEAHVMRHRLFRLEAEIDWHEELLAALPEIIEDEKSRTGTPS
ncbi:PadR family transcriptional regulator [Cellulomonas sp. NPDC055163]